MTVHINGNDLTLEELIRVARFWEDVTISDESKQDVKKSREYVDRVVADGRVIYGVTTGFGKFSDVRISPEETELLQRNLIMSHACGTGPLFPEETVRGIILLRANALSKGYSGIRLETLQSLVDLINHGVYPAIPEKGSLGASGDLAPLAHMTLPLLGMGEAWYKGVLMSGEEALQKAGLKPAVLGAKEGLALINGTQVLTAVGGIATYDAWKLMKLCDISASMTGEALTCIVDAFMHELHIVRPHKGQITTAANMRKLLAGSERTTRQGEVRVQDAYSLRCIPQINGASKDVINYALDKVLIEINSATDNPIILPELDLALSGGNFHGQPMALTFDMLGIAVAELANVAERRIERLVNPQLSGLPAFLTPHGGLNSGFMIAQYAAAALVSENKVLAHPASVDSIPSSANQEDHVSMGTIAARKARDITDNASRVIAIELTAAAQAIDLSAEDGKKIGEGAQVAYDMIREVVSPMYEDRILYKDFERVLKLVKSGAIVDAVEKKVGSLD
ncbi:MAG: histidine ammonia-lyase [Synergistaceae bacterium]|jgi:histidine ammonia-lyase|nr:histidine ammonia-lyase [Synergistaceae bacterium]